MRLLRQSQSCLLFYLRKILSAQKRKLKQNQLTNKNKPAKNDKDNGFLHAQKLLRRWKLFVWGYGTICAFKIFLQEKNKQA